MKYNLVYENKEGQAVILDKFDCCQVALSRIRGLKSQGFYVSDYRPQEVAPGLVRLEQRFFTSEYTYIAYTYKGLKFTVLAGYAEHSKKNFDGGIYIHEDSRTKDKPSFYAEYNKPVAEAVHNVRNLQNLIAQLDILITKQNKKESLHNVQY